MKNTPARPRAARTGPRGSAVITGAGRHGTAVGGPVGEAVAGAAVAVLNRDAIRRAIKANQKKG